MHSVYSRYLDLKQQHPKKYARDLAALMGISEAELMAARCGQDAHWLRPEMAALLARLESVGETKCITRNEYAVHEHLGTFSNQKISPHAGIVLNPRALDLRVFISQWHSAFLLAEAGSERQSIQIFDAHGDAVLKVYTTDATSTEVWQQVIADFRQPLTTEFSVTPGAETVYASEVNPAQVENQWRAMTDVHQFFGLLKHHNLSRQQAFRAVSDDLACQVDNRSLATLLNRVREDGNEIMIFVGNRGCVQIFTGVLEKVLPMRNWLNIFNPAFTLHLQEQQIAESWITRKPTADGIVTSLELFAADGTQIAQLYGQRSEGTPEQSQWREQLNALMAPQAVAV